MNIKGKKTKAASTEDEEIIICEPDYKEMYHYLVAAMDKAIYEFNIAKRACEEHIKDARRSVYKHEEIYRDDLESVSRGGGLNSLIYTAEDLAELKNKRNKY